MGVKLALTLHQTKHMHTHVCVFLVLIDQYLYDDHDDYDDHKVSQINYTFIL